MKIFALLPWIDWLALVAFLALWVGYGRFSRELGKRRPSLASTTDRYRVYWMREAAARDPRMLDGLINQALSQTPSFFSSTSILVIGAMPPPGDFVSGKFDLRTYADRAAEMVKAAAESFHDGLRAYYFSFAAMAWFLSPLAMLLASFVVVVVLYGREFHGDVLKILGEDKKPPA